MSPGTLSSAQPPARPAKPELAQPSTASDSGGDTAAEASDAAAPTASAAEGSASLQDQDGQDGIERGSTVPAAGAEQHQDDSSAASVASSEGEQSGREGPDEVCTMALLCTGFCTVIMPLQLACAAHARAAASLGTHQLCTGLSNAFGGKQICAGAVLSFVNQAMCKIPT